MEEIRVNTAGIEAVRSQLETVMNEIRKETARLKDSLESLGEMWSGEAHTAWQEGIHLDLAQLEEALRGLMSLTEYETAAIREYESCEAEITGWIESLGGKEIG